MSEWRETGFLGQEFIRALETAARLHAMQPRKKTDVPYISHLMGTCAIALEYGANREQAIAALLHDVLEDVLPTELAKANVLTFGHEVLRIVRACTDGLPDEQGEKAGWVSRKEAYLASLTGKDAAVLLVSASDKLYNARAIVDDFHRADVGAKVFERFNHPRKDTLWYYRELVRAFKGNNAHNPDLVRALDRTVREMHELVGADPDATGR